MRDISIYEKGLILDENFNGFSEAVKKAAVSTENRFNRIAGGSVFGCFIGFRLDLMMSRA
jgi:hypothetical protein